VPPQPKGQGQAGQGQGGQKAGGGAGGPAPAACPPGMVRASPTAKCGCKQGTRFIGGKCIGVGTELIVPDASGRVFAGRIPAAMAVRTAA
jgi:hypothetical protein